MAGGGGSDGVGHAFIVPPAVDATREARRVCAVGAAQPPHWSIAPPPPPPEPPADAERRRRAVEFNDDVVQGLVVARMAVEMGDLDKAAEAIDRSLDAARRIVGDLLDEGDPVRPGSLVRRPAGR